MKAALIVVLCVLWAKVAAQSDTEPVRSGSDKAQELFDGGFNRTNGPSNDTVPVIVHVQEMPSYPGGPDSLRAYVKRAFNFPNDKALRKMGGNIYVEFTVEKDGSVIDVVLRKGVHPILDAEALRVIGSMKGWIPGKSDGEPVTARFVQKITVWGPLAKRPLAAGQR